MTFLQAIYLGIVEGLTEFLPISSTGHLILLSHYFQIPQDNFLVVFEIAIQLGAICAVVLLFRKRLFRVQTIKRLAVAFIPTGIAGFLIYPHIKALLTNPLIVGITLLIGGIIILFAENYYFKQQQNNLVEFHHEISIKEAFLLGLYQVLAMIPGVSRSGAVIVGGLYMKMERRLLTEFTFLLAVPTMSAATLYSMYKNQEAIMQAGNFSLLLTGILTSFVVATFVIKLFLDYIKRHTFIVFGVYRIILGIIVCLVFLP